MDKGLGAVGDRSGGIAVMTGTGIEIQQTRNA